jgi:DNA-binding PadR family transcriptional regulator
VGKTDHLGEFEQLVLLAVMRLGDEAYGANIQQVLEQHGDREASISAIYITLTRLEDKGMVTSTMGSPEAIRGGKRRRYFALDPAGVAALNDARGRLLAMWSGLEREIDAAGASRGDR